MVSLPIILGIISDGELVQGALKSLHRDGEIERDGHGWKVR